MAKQKLQPRIRRICTECGCADYLHNHQGPFEVDFANGKSVRAYKLRCRVCKKDCGLSTRVLTPSP